MEPETNAPEMVTLTFARAFKLRLDDGSELSISEGEQAIPKEYENHWYVKENLSVPPVIDLPAVPLSATPKTTAPPKTGKPPLELEG